MSNLHRLASLLAVAGFGVLLGCMPSLPKKKCEAKMSYQGADVVAIGESEPWAKESVCLRYCYENDEGVTKAYDAWKKSPDGQASKAGRSFEIDLNAELNALKDTCNNGCLAAIDGGSAKVEVSCD
jgi:hypothetical protein